MVRPVLVEHEERPRRPRAMRGCLIQEQRDSGARCRAWHTGPGGWHRLAWALLGETKFEVGGEKDL